MVKIALIQPLKLFLIDFREFQSLFRVFPASEAADPAKFGRAARDDT